MSVHQHIQTFLIVANLCGLAGRVLSTATAQRQLCRIKNTLHHMRHKLGLYLRLTLALIVISAVQLSAQDVVEFPDINTLTPENVFQATIDPIYSALIILFGYLSTYIPGIQKVGKFARVFAFALVLGLGFYLFGHSIWKVAFTYFFTTRFLYDGLLVHLKRSPATT